MSFPYSIGLTGCWLCFRRIGLSCRPKVVVAITLFGSVARGDAANSYDIDLAIRAGDGFSTGGLQDILENILLIQSYVRGMDRAAFDADRRRMCG